MHILAMDSAITRDLFGDAEVGTLFSDSAVIRSCLLVEGALAAAQGKLEIIPELSAHAIHRAAREVQVDAGALTAGTARDGIFLPSLVAAFRTAMNAPEHAQFAHWGATSQDILDTALVLRLRRCLDIMDARLEQVIADLADVAKDHRATPMAARTRNQLATPTSFGARVVNWTSPLLRHRERIAELRPRLLMLSLSGASGNGTAFQGRGREIAEIMADELGLGVPVTPQHVTRDAMAEMGHLCSLITGSLGKIANDLILSAQIGEGIRAGEGGGSSTMPHKSNPAAEEVILALARHVGGLSSQLNGSMIHAQEREGSAWAVEWLALPQMVVGAAACLRHAGMLAASIQVEPEKLAAPFDATNGLMMAEAARFALAGVMDATKAAALVKEACKTTAKTGKHLRDVLQAEVTQEIDFDAVFDAANALGDAPAIVDAFLKELKT